MSVSLRADKICLFVSAKIPSIAMTLHSGKKKKAKTEGDKNQNSLINNCD